METARLLRIRSSHHTCSSFRSTFTGSNVVRAAPCRVATPRKCNIQEVRAAIIAEPAKLDVKTFKGDSLGSENLALKVADSSVAKGLVHRYVVLIRQNGRAGTASTKTRAEVRGGGRKPYAQKGTGNARQGSKRTPLRPGGGVVFGPKPCDWTIKMNKKERRLALATALQSAAPNITIVDNLKVATQRNLVTTELKLGTSDSVVTSWNQGKPITKGICMPLFSIFREELANTIMGGVPGMGERKEAVPEPKTKMVTAGLAAVGVDIEKESALLIVSDLFENLRLATRNIQRLTVNRTDLLSAYDVLRADKIIIEKSALKYIQDFFGGAKAVDVEEPQAVAA